MDEGLVYTGKIVALEEIEGAHFIISATVVCGKGGKWKGIMRKNECDIFLLVTVYLPDALIDEEHAQMYGMEFLKSSNYRVKMRRFKGAPSEVVIMPLQVAYSEIGDDCTKMLGITKYHKPIPAHLQGKAKGNFPSFIPKTDEPNYQNAVGQAGIELLAGKPFYITEKADGSSTTAYKYKGEFGVCSRNWELQRDENNGYWQVAIQHNLEEKLPEGIALQWETCGPKIQNNPMGLKKIDGFAFSAYNIEEKEYLEFDELCKLSEQIDFPMVMIVASGSSFPSNSIESLGRGNYENGKPREGVVVRSTTNLLGHKPVSFKVINLDYDK